MLEFVLLSVVGIFFIVGLFGIVAPVIPSLPLAWLGIFIYTIFSQHENIGINIVIITGFIALFGVIVDLVSNILGAKLFGASMYGIVGSIIGGLAGFVVGSIFGAIIGSFVGAFVGEYTKRKLWKESLQAALGTIVGFLLGSVLKIVLLITMAVIFIIALF